MEFDINFMAVLAGAVAPMIIGFAWYSKALFGKAWMKLAGISEAQIKEANSNMPMLYGTMFLTSIVMSYVLARFIMIGDKAMGTVPDMMTGAMVGFWAWLGFVATTMLTGVLFDKKPFKLYLITTGYQLVSLVVMGAILASMS